MIQIIQTPSMDVGVIIDEPVFYRIHADGTVEIFDAYATQFDTISIDADVFSRILSEYATQGEQDETGMFVINDDADTESLLAVFWDEINHELDDPFFMDSSERESKPFSSAYKTLDEMNDVINCAIASYTLLRRSQPFVTIVEAETDDDGAGLNDDDHTPDDLVPLICAIVDRFQPYGWEWSYCDSNDNHQSGYALTAYTLEYQSDEAAPKSSREHLASPKHLRALLAEHNIEIPAWLPKAA